MGPTLSRPPIPICLKSQSGLMIEVWAESLEMRGGAHDLMTQLLDTCMYMYMCVCVCVCACVHVCTTHPTALPVSCMEDSYRNDEEDT